MCAAQKTFNRQLDPWVFYVYLYDPDWVGRWIPVDFSDDDHWDWYAETDQNGIWPAVFEAGFAVMMDDYWAGGGYDWLDEKIDAGFGIPALTNNDYTGMLFWDNGAYTISVNALYDFIDDWRENDPSSDNMLMVTRTTWNNDAWLAANGWGFLHAGHAYSIIGVGQENEQDVVYLRNPWGLTNDYEDQGEFWMTIASFRDIFRGMDWEFSA